MADRSVSVPMTLSDLESWDARGQIFQADLLNNVRTVSSRTSKFGRITNTHGEGRISRGSLSRSKYQISKYQRSKVNLQGAGNIVAASRTAC